MDWKSFTLSCSRSVLFAETLRWAKWNVISNIFTSRAHRSTHINNFTNHQEHSGSCLRRWEYARRSSSRKSPGFPSSVLHKQYTSTFSFDVPMPAGRKAWMKALGLPHIRCLVSWPGVQMWPQADIESLSIWLSPLMREWAATLRECVLNGCNSLVLRLLSLWRWTSHHDSDVFKSWGGSWSWSRLVTKFRM